MIYSGVGTKSTRAPLFLLGFFLSLSAGCAHLPLIGRKAVPTQPALSDSVRADSVRAADQTEVKTRRPPLAAGKPSAPTTAQGGPTTSPENNAPAPTTAPAAPDTVRSRENPAAVPRVDPTSAPVLSADIPPEEKAKLVDATQRDLKRAEELLQSLAGRSLSPGDEDKLHTAEGLVQAAREAGLRSEVREAASLAHKAWLLALDLSGR